MNLHTASSEISRAELEELVSTSHSIISSQTSSPVICIVQDCLLALYMMSRNPRLLGDGMFWQILSQMKNRSTRSITKRVRELQENTTCPFEYNSVYLISVVFPNNFSYKSSNVEIVHGIIVRGFLTKAELGSRPHSIMAYLHKYYSPQIALKCFSNIQHIANAWLAIVGFSVGIEDCMMTTELNIRSAVEKSFVNNDLLQSTVMDKDILESRICVNLGSAKDVGMRIAKDALRSDNNFLSTVMSGSKGDFFNIAQITGLLGQQYVEGRRIQKTLVCGTKTLPHTMTNDYKARGFIASSFYKGLDPVEFWFHAESGREGVCDTSMKTATSGYVQRKMVKVCEDIRVQYDRTVRNSSGHIIQFMYGGDGLCPTECMSSKKAKNGLGICDISYILDMYRS
jgi:DNA-directed RNA polymerase II subunit RPB1